jgi:hypothetical protein
MITVKCDCGESYRANEEHLGRSIRCRKCGCILTVRSPAAVSPATTSPTSDVVSANTRSKQRWWQGTRVRNSAIAAGLIAAVALAYRNNTSQSRPSATAHEPGATNHQSELVPAMRPDTPNPQPAAEDPVAALASLGDSATPSDSSCTGLATRPATNDDLVGGELGGYSSISIANGTRADAVVALVNKSRQELIRQIFVRRGETGQLRSLPAGSYSLRFALGEGYLSDGGFCSLFSASEFDRPILLREIHDDEGIRYSADEITLHGVVNGNARAHSIDPALVFGQASANRN